MSLVFLAGALIALAAGLYDPTTVWGKADFVVCFLLFTIAILYAIEEMGRRVSRAIQLDLRRY